METMMPSEPPRATGRPEPYYPHHEGWVPLHPEPEVRSTYWPAVLAAGIMMLLWGVLGSMILSGAGIIVFIVGVVGWVKELNRGGTDHTD